tara:strand:+ start:193 stop:1023 length:831 start_codon:yes stop_codon:yes gene_type:complete
MKIAFLFLTIDQPYFTKAWEKYFQNNQDKFNIYLHPKNKNSVTNYLFKNNIVPNIKNTNWGFLIEAQISLLETSLTHDKNNQKFILLSDSCLPSKNFDKLYSFLNNNNNNKISFINLLSQYKSFNSNINKNYKYKHSQWFCLDRHHVKKLLLKKNTIINELKHTKAGDEYFLNYILPDKNIIDFPITNVDWSNKDLVQSFQTKVNKLWKQYDKYKDNKTLQLINKYKKIKAEYAKHPKTYYEITDELISKIKNSDSFFFRKFDKNIDLNKYLNNIL